MNGALNRVIAPSRQQIAGVDDDGVLHGSCIDKCSVGALDLQTAPVVLEEKCDGSIILYQTC